MNEAYGRLSPAMQYQIVNGLGFRELRPVQELAIGTVLADKNCVVLAPTAGGKSEAAFFPLLSRMDTEAWDPVSVIYVAPIRALLNNQEDRLHRYAQLVGRRVFKWHGDTPQAQRRAFINDPADILLTTPESLEVMMMSRHVPARRLFRALRAVVIDEIHAFVDDDRGGHLSALLERLSRFCGSDVQRIGLSATVGNPETILDWVRGSSNREAEVVQPPAEIAEPELALDYVASLENAAQVIAGLHNGKKRLVFVDSRRRVEALGKHLGDLGVTAYVSHSSLSVEDRMTTERAFAEDRNCVIVATSALELGIDIGDLDHVLHVDAPATVAAFLQRMGRTGRRPGMRANCTFLATTDEALVQAAALLRLHGSGFVEPLEPTRQAPHLLAHQIMALSIQEDGIAESDWWAWISSATPFSALGDDDRAELLQHMRDEGLLASDRGRLFLGPKGERLYGFRNFGELYAVFSTPKYLTVMWGSKEIGTIEAAFAEQTEIGRLSFVLAARSWQATSIDWENGAVHVEPVKHSREAWWQGQPRLLRRELCEAIRQVLVSQDEDVCWSKRARAKLAEQREEYAHLPESGLFLDRDVAGFRVWTFAGGRANNILARAAASLLGEKVTANNLYIGFREQAGESPATIANTLANLCNEQRPTQDDAVRFAAQCARARLSKFQPCLPERLELLYLAGRLMDPDTARAVLRNPLTVALPEGDGGEGVS